MAPSEGLLWVVVLGVSASIAIMFALEVPEPYMDEIFHVPQCQAYCEGRFSYWDPMITTFPGLYYAALVILSPIQGGTALWNLLQGDPPWSAFRATCSTTLLRAVNIVLSLVCLVVFREIAAETRRRSEELLEVENKSQDLGVGENKTVGGKGPRTERTVNENESRELGTEGKGTAENLVGRQGKASAVTRRGRERKPRVKAPETGVSNDPGGAAYKMGKANYGRQKNQRPRLKDTLKAATLALYPPHFFFAFLFYTDVGSTAAVGAMYLAGLRHRFWLAAVLAVVAILFRQTNVVWALFVTCTGAAEVLWPLPGSAPSGRAEKRSLDRTEQVSPLALWSLAVRAWTHRTAVLRRFGPLLSVIAGFVVFAVWNGGIVLGAKDAHKMSAHLPQFLYCLAFVFCALAPVQLLPAHVAHVFADVRGRVGRAPARALALVIAALAAVHWFTLEHPYLLADNRHYPFYLWRWIFKRHVAIRYLLVPGYLYAATSFVLSLAKTQRPFWIFFYLGATLGVLVPAPLIEFRYFNIPFFLAAFHVPMPLNRRRPALWLQIVLFAAVNVGSVYLFLRRPFRWPHEEGTQRFMW